MLKGFMQTRAGQFALAFMVVASWCWLLWAISWGLLNNMVQLATVLQMVGPLIGAFGGGAGVHYITTVIQNGKNGNGNGAGNGNGNGVH